MTWLRRRRGAARDLAVYDVDQKREVFATEWEYDPSVTIGSEEFLLSRSGRTLVGGSPVGVWDVDASIRRWNPPPGRSIFRGLDELDAFLVLETWDEPWTRGKLQNFNTVAVHDLDSAAFRYRCWERDAELFQCLSDDHTLGVVVAKNVISVWSLPFRVNWQLLCICQAILALPLVLLWIIFRPRRRTHRAPDVTAPD